MEPTICFAVFSKMTFRFLRWWWSDAYLFRLRPLYVLKSKASFVSNLMLMTWQNFQIIGRCISWNRSHFVWNLRLMTSHNVRIVGRFLKHSNLRPMTLHNFRIVIRFWKHSNLRPIMLHNYRMFGRFCQHSNLSPMMLHDFRLVTNFIRTEIHGNFVFTFRKWRITCEKNFDDIKIY